MNVLLIGNEYYSPDFCSYANQNGYNLISMNISNAENIKEIQSLNLDDIISFSDQGQVIVEQLKEKLKMPGRNLSLINTLTNKTLMRKSDQISQLLPKSLVFDSTTSIKCIEEKLSEHGMGLPLVIKPAHGFYSSGVTRINNCQELSRAIQIAKRINAQLGHHNGDVIIEEYLDGPEIAIDGVIIGGLVYPLIKHHKYPVLKGPYFHEQAYITQVLSGKFSEKATLEKFIETIGLCSGPFHIEMRKSANGDWRLLECAPRFSGMGLSTNLPYYLLTQQHAYDFLFSKYPPHNFQDVNEKRVVEFDFSVSKSGILSGLSQVIQKIKARYHCQLFPYAKDGDYVLSPPENMNTILTVFNKVNDHEEAISFCDELLSFKEELMQ